MFYKIITITKYKIHHFNRIYVQFLKISIASIFDKKEDPSFTIIEAALQRCF